MDASRLVLPAAWDLNYHLQSRRASCTRWGRSERTCAGDILAGLPAASSRSAPSKRPRLSASPPGCLPRRWGMAGQEARRM